MKTLLSELRQLVISACIQLILSTFFVKMKDFVCTASRIHPFNNLPFFTFGGHSSVLLTVINKSSLNLLFAFNRKSFWQRFVRRNKRWKIRIRQMVKHQAFYWAVLICVFLNTVITALQHYGQPDWLTRFQGKACLPLR